MFWIAIFLKIYTGVILRFASFEKYAYRSILMIDHRRFDDVKETKDFIALFPLTAHTFSHLWIRLAPPRTSAQPESEWAMLISDDYGDVDQGINAALNPLHNLVVLSQPFYESCYWSEYI